MNNQTTTKDQSKWAKRAGIIGIGLCGLCCALPVLSIVGGASVLATIAVYAEKVAIILFIISGGIFALLLYRKKQAPACAIDCDCKTETTQQTKSKTVN